MKFKRVGALILVLAIVATAGLAIAVGLNAYDAKADADARKGVNNLVERALARNASSETIEAWAPGNKYYDVAELLEDALKIQTYRLDIMHSQASAYLLGDSSLGNFDKIVGTYERILDSSPNDPKGLFYLAFWKHYQKNAANYGSASVTDSDIAALIGSLNTHYRAEKITYLLTSMEKAFASEISGTLSGAEIDAYKNDGNAGILVLGCSLDSKGQMIGVLVQRLEKAKELADLFPDMNVIVSGGAPVKGNSEAILMKQWLIDEGIDEDRILTQDYGTDPVTKTAYALPLLSKNGITNVLLVTSASQAHGSEIYLAAAATVNNYPVNTRTVAYMDVSAASAKNADAVAVIYADTVRALNECRINIMNVVDTVAYDESRRDHEYWIPGEGLQPAIPGWTPPQGP